MSLCSIGENQPLKTIKFSLFECQAKELTIVVKARLHKAGARRKISKHKRRSKLLLRLFSSSNLVYICHSIFAKIFIAHLQFSISTFLYFPPNSPSTVQSSSSSDSKESLDVLNKINLSDFKFEVRRSAIAN